jgi:hypothetical protein
VDLTAGLQGWSSWVALATLLIVPSTLIPAGIFSFGPVPVPLGTIGAKLTVVTTLQPDPFPAFTWALEGSLNAGATWMGAGSVSGPSQNRAGKPLGMGVSGGDFLNASTNPNRQLRGSATLSGPATVAMTLQAIS